MELISLAKKAHLAGEMVKEIRRLTHRVGGSGAMTLELDEALHAGNAS